MRTRTCDLCHREIKINEKFFKLQEYDRGTLKNYKDLCIKCVQYKIFIIGK